jgi:predicted 3-demethylubiquinone-9 3-methyltransferase (glyoxalase superfamily)
MSRYPDHQIEDKNMTNKITTFLTFDNRAEDAMNFYVSIFKNSRIVSVTRLGDGPQGEKGTLMTGTFMLDGQQFMALNGGPHFEFADGISLFVDCKSQKEVDDLWARLSADGGMLICE